MKADVKDIKTAFSDLRTAVLMIQVDKHCLSAMPDTTKPLTLEIKVKRKKRSLSANALMWELCKKISEKTGIYKNDVYREAILNAGHFSTVRVMMKAAARLINDWERNGVGWIAVPLGDDGEWVDIQLYAGSSGYDSKQMSRIIDYLFDACHELNIDTISQAERERLENEWK